MRVLFDHNVPHKLRQSLLEHAVSTADEMDWAQLENGELLGEAEATAFDVMLTCDKNLSYQQNLRGRVLALIVLSTNDWSVVRRNSGLVADALKLVAPRTFQVIKLPGSVPPR